MFCNYNVRYLLQNSAAAAIMLSRRVAVLTEIMTYDTIVHSNKNPKAKSQKRKAKATRHNTTQKL